MPTFHLLLKGKVQGVFYRATAKKMADKFNLSGWIKNTKEGHVESIVTGSNEQVQQFINWCKTGPEKANVEEVQVTPTEEILFNDFQILPSR